MSGAMMSTPPLPLVVMMMVAGGIPALMLGTTEPTEGTGLLMRGDMEGMLASWERSVTAEEARGCVTPSAVSSTAGGGGNGGGQVGGASGGRMYSNQRHGLIYELSTQTQCVCVYT